MTAAAPTRRLLEVLATGPLTTVQDLGRTGLAHLGVPRSGAADLGAFRLGARLLGNPEHAAALEVTLGGLALRAHADLLVAVTGAAVPLTLAGRPVPRRTVLHWPAGTDLRMGTATAGLRAYLAVRGGIDVPAVLGSRASDLFGGIGPPALLPGDLLPVGRPGPQHPWPQIEHAPGADPPSGEVRLRLLPGPQHRALRDGPAALTAGGWSVSTDSDRVGLRLDGDPVATLAGASVPSEPLVRGALQLPPSGQPVLFLADHPVTGGYPVVGVLTEADADVAAQLRPGQTVRFGVLRGGTAGW